MDFQTLSSQGIVEHLKCTLCSNFLSYFLIYNSDDQNVCGRCTLPQNKPFYRNQLYEVVVQCLKFPCRYKNEGCDEEVFPSDMPQHEKRCPYRRIKCPVVDICKWEETRFTLIQHCQDEHTEGLINNSEFELDLTKTGERKHFLEHNSLLLYVESKFDLVTKDFDIAIYHLEDETDNEPFPFRLTLKNGTRYVSIQLTASKFSEKCFTDVSLVPLTSRSENFPFRAIGNITFGESSNDVNITTFKHLQDLKCSDCSELISPPIHQCSLKHNIVLCSKCVKKHLSSCITCRQLLYLIHNFESLKDGYAETASLLDRFCKYKEKGCSVVVTADEINRHEEFCPKNIITCPHHHFGKCLWEGSIETVVGHIEQYHQSKIMQNNSKHSWTLRHKENTYGTFQQFIKYSGYFFYLIYVRNGYCVRWIMQTVGTCEENFCFEIEVIDGYNSGSRKFKMTGPCSPLTETIELIQNKKYVSLLYLDQVEELMCNGNFFTYKINIFKKEKNIPNVTSIDM